MSGRKCRALKGRNWVSRADRRRTINRTLTPDQVLMRLVGEIDRRDRRSIQRNKARFKGAKSRRAGRRGAYTYRPPAVFLGTLADILG